MGGRLDGKTSLERHSHLCPLAGLHPSPTSFDPHHHPSSTLRTLAPLKKKARFSTTLFVSYAGAARYAAEHLAHLLADDFGAFGPLAGKPYVVPAKAAAFVFLTGYVGYVQPESAGTWLELVYGQWWVRAFGWLMAFLQVPATTIALMKSLTDDPLIMLLLINVVLLVLGTFMDMAPMIIICTPIFLPVVKAIGMDPVHFGVVLILNAGIGLNTPPVGTVQFVACAIGKVSISESMRTIWPFYGALGLCLALVTYVPAFSTWLPGLVK